MLKNEQTNENSICYADLLFSSERCVVSGGAAKLMALVHQTLKVSIHVKCLVFEVLKN